VVQHKSVFGVYAVCANLNLLYVERELFIGTQFSILYTSVSKSAAPTDAVPRGSHVPRTHHIMQIIACIRGTRPWLHTTQCVHNKERERARERVYSERYSKEVRDAQHALYKCQRRTSLTDTVCPSLNLPGRPSVYRRSTAAAAVHCLSPHLSH
jgi:hypothetical protein